MGFPGNESSATIELYRSAAYMQARQRSLTRAYRCSALNIISNYICMFITYKYFRLFSFFSLWYTKFFEIFTVDFTTDYLTISHRCRLIGIYHLTIYHCILYCFIWLYVALIFKIIKFSPFSFLWSSWS